MIHPLADCMCDYNGAAIGAGSVVTKGIPDGTVWHRKSC